MYSRLSKAGRWARVPYPYGNTLELSTFRFEPQNFEQGITNIEVMENLIKLHNSTFLVQPARNAFGQIGDSTSMFISVPQLLFHLSASA
jgi:hypothetical protein